MTSARIPYRRANFERAIPLWTYSNWPRASLRSPHSCAEHAPRSAVTPGVDAPVEGADTSRVLGSLFLMCLSVITVGLFVRGLLIESFFVPSTSMSPTLQPSDHVVVAKLSYGLQVPFLDKHVVTWGTPRRGQIVVFRRRDDPSTASDESARSMVKRVIGVAGDSIQVDGTSVSINGRVLDEPYARWLKGGALKSHTFRVPQGTLFVLGDNRDESYDSRSWSEPFVEVSRVVGPVTVVY